AGQFQDHGRDQLYQAWRHRLGHRRKRRQDHRRHDGRRQGLGHRRQGRLQLLTPSTGVSQGAARRPPLFLCRVAAYLSRRQGRRAGPMIYDSAESWLEAPEKRVMLFGMSGLGKTHVASMLRRAGGWFHYSVDYRIGTRYMGELIADEFKLHAMQVPLLRELLLTDSVRIRSNITFDNLAPLSMYLGKPGDPARGGLAFPDYMTRQNQHRAAEIAAMLDCGHFITRARAIYGYRDFVCDSSGSVCEVVFPDDPDDPVLTATAALMLPVWIRGTEAHTAELVRRFDRAPKPMYY